MSTTGLISGTVYVEQGKRNITNICEEINKMCVLRSATEGN